MRNPVAHGTRRSVRLSGFDYSTPGAYFVTLVTQSRRFLFGRVSDGMMYPNDAGLMVARCWQGLSHTIPFACLDSLVVMPNHMHAIVFIQGPDTALAPSPDDAPVRRFGGRQGGLLEVVRDLKSVTTAQYSRGVHDVGWVAYNGRLWQRSYDERIIRNDRQLHARREYILNNPLQWTLDEENPDRAPKRTLPRR